MSYDTVFTKRASSYLNAVNTFPNVMKYENFHIAKALDLRENDRLLQVACAGVYIQPFFDVSCDYVRIEQNEVMASLDDALYCPLHSIPYEDESFDKIVIAATLHHYSEEERGAFYREVVRLLKPGGRFVLCDVLKGSEQDSLLNTCVNMYNPGGHVGNFFTEEYANTLREHFSDVATTLHTYPWEFRSVQEFNIYCNTLFYLKKLPVNDTYETLSRYITIQSNIDNTLRMKWNLLYFVCTK